MNAEGLRHLSEGVSCPTGDIRSVLIGIRRLSDAIRWLSDNIS